MSKNKKEKFRGFRVSDNTWVYGELIEEGSDYFIKNDEGKHFIERKSPCIFTGFTDVKGKEIYVFDEVKCENFGDQTYAVGYFFLPGDFLLQNTVDDKDILHLSESLNLYKMEIVGNYYESSIREV